MMIRRVLLIMAVFLLGACANYPMEPLKEGLVPADAMAQWRSDPVWWAGYADPRLNALVTQALENNIDLARSAITVNRALYQAKLLGAELVPTFSGSAEAGTSNNLRTGTAGDSWKSSLAVQYEIDLWQRLTNAASAQEWEYRATELDREAVRLTLVNSVIDAYFRLRYLQEAIAVTENSMARYARLLEIVRLKYNVGKVAAIEPLQAEQFLLAARNSLLSLEVQRSTTEQTLRDLLNARPGETFALGRTPFLDTPTVPVDLSVPVAALSARPDIKAAEARLQGAFKTVQAQENSWYPGVSIGSTLGTSADSAGNFFKVPLLSSMVQVTFPFLQWNTLRWNIKISEADFERTRLGFTQTVTTALNEVAAARFSWENAGQTLANTLAKNEKDRRIGDYYQTRYDLGAAELKDYLDALNTADNSMLAALDAKYQVIRAENLVFRAMGSRWTAGGPGAGAGAGVTPAPNGGEGLKP